VYAARTPLEIDALGEALATNLETGELKRDQIPFPYTILRSGANLIMFDEIDKLVVPTHDSVRKFLDSFKKKDEDLNDLVIDAATLDLGEVCIAHLLWHASKHDDAESATASAGKPNTTPQRFPPIEQMGNWIKPPAGKLTSLMSSLIPKDKVNTASSNKRNQAPLVLNLEASPTPALKLYRPFHRYARKNWTLLTRDFTEKTADWTRFKSFISLDTQVEKGRSDAEMFPWRVDGTESPLGWAISEGHLALLELSLTSRQQILSQPLEHYGGLSPLHLASKRGRVEIFKKLYEMKRPTYVDLSPDTGRTSMHYAAEQGHSEIVDYLLSASTRPNAAGTLRDRDREDYSPICLAIISGSITTIKIMVPRCRNSFWDPSHINDYLDALVAGGSQREMADFVLDNLVPKEDPDKSSQKILSWVLLKNNLSLIPNLVKAGVSLNRSLGSGAPAIFFALAASTPALATAFIENGARTEMKIEWPCDQRRHFLRMQVLYPIDLILSRGWTPLASLVYPMIPQDDRFHGVIEISLLVTNTKVYWLSILMRRQIITGVSCGTHASCAFAAQLIGKEHQKFLFARYQHESQQHLLKIHMACHKADYPTIHLRVMMGTRETTVYDWKERPGKDPSPLQRYTPGNTVGATIGAFGNKADLKFNNNPYNIQTVFYGSRIDKPFIITDRAHEHEDCK
jgi:hypothetical protein